MLRRVLLLLCLLTPALVYAQNGTNVTWHDARDLTIEGKGWTNTLTFFDRYPAKAGKMVRKPVWELSKDSAGMAVRFLTDATEINARWVLRKSSLAMPHMPATGVSGLDLYVKEEGKWQWVGRGAAKEFPTNEVFLFQGRRPVYREFLLYLPLYNGVQSVEIGVPASARFAAAPVRAQKPIVFYGTSILQGGCASRPGMAYPALIGRHLDWPTINLGFSGNAKSEPEVAQLLAELDPALYVLDPLPNMDPTGVKERIEPFVNTLRKAHPRTPIALVEHIVNPDAKFVDIRRYDKDNAELRSAYERLRKAGVKDLYYISCEKLLGADGEGTVDGTHPTDLGFARMAEEIGPVLKKILKKRS